MDEFTCRYCGADLIPLLASQIWRSFDEVRDHHNESCPEYQKYLQGNNNDEPPCSGNGE